MSDSASGTLKGGKSGQKNAMSKARKRAGDGDGKGGPVYETGKKQGGLASKPPQVRRNGNTLKRRNDRRGGGTPWQVHQKSNAERGILDGKRPPPVKQMAKKPLSERRVV